MRKTPLFTILFVIFSLTSNQSSWAGGYLGFTELKAKDCVAFDQRQLQNLPPSWHRYGKFVKKCPLKKSAGSKPVVSIISIWTEEYLDTKEVRLWEDFPLSMIVDENLNEVATLPLIFPMDSPSEPAVYFGKWKSALPTEIRVDVRDPTVSGDYYYAPFIWNDKDKRYYMTDKEPKSGTRPKR